MLDAKTGSRGFTLIASLLLLLMLSGFALGLLMMVNTEQRVSGNDLNNSYTYRATEGAIEKMTSDLANTFKNIQAPQSSQICALSANFPTWDSTVTYPTYNVAPVPSTPGANPCTTPMLTVWGLVQSGADAGLYAQIIPVTMNASAQRATGETVSMTRTAEVALIPVFQFGVFSDSDLFFGRSPHLGFAGRIHTNGDLYLGVANGYNLVFGDKMAAFGNVIRFNMDNGVATVGNNNQGTVMIPTQASGCATQMANVPAASPSATCVDIATTALGSTLGSVVGAHGSAQNTASWQNVSLATYQGYLIDGNGQPNGLDGPNATGATDLTLPFVTGTTSAVQIIRRPPASEALTSLLSQSRLANQAQIRILLSDTQAGLHLLDWNGNAAQDYQLVGPIPAPIAALGQGASAGGTQPTAGIVVPSGGLHTYYFGESWCSGTSTLASYPASRACPATGDPNFIVPPIYGPVSNGPGGAAMTPTAFPAAASFTTADSGANGLQWPIINGWLLVEAKWTSDGLWHGVTSEWLQLGFARGLSVPVQPGISSAGAACTPPASNSIGTVGCNYIPDMTNAILYFQVTADRNGDGTVNASDAFGNSIAYYGAGSQYNWYPINFYDAREGENWDVAGTFVQGTGTPNGVMNAVEIDVGNLRNWLLGKTGTTGPNVNYAVQNGYILYFSDRRGMQFATAAQGANYQNLWGEYGYEDVVNYANAGANFVPDGHLDPVNYNGVSPEDVNGNLALDNYGVKYVGDAFGPSTTTDTDTTAPPTPYAPGHRITTFTVGRANRVTGARHVLKLVDGSLGNLPTMPPGNATNNCSQSAANPTGCGGFTVASENPVYIQGNYNSNCPSAAAGSACTPGNTNYDTTWTGGATEPTHAAVSVITDALTMLSNNWQDAGTSTSTTNGSLKNSINPGGQSVPAIQPNRISITTYYRVAVAAGKTIAFNNPTQNPEFAFGMDGGVHNFLRFLEDWGGIASQQQLYYKGSIVSLYWNMYGNGTFKCCNLVYNPPDRQYTFDGLFAQPQNLPPGTPMFRNVDNLTYRQNQVARTN